MVDKTNKINFSTSDEIWSEVTNFKDAESLKNNNQALEELIQIATTEYSRKKGNLKFVNVNTAVVISPKTKEHILHFYDGIPLMEKRNNVPLIIYPDNRIGAVYTICGITAKNLVNLMDLDAVIDPINQRTYRENRDLKPKDPDFQVMKDDAKLGRPFNDIVIEYVSNNHPNKYRSELPLKVLGGQHRCEAIKAGITNSQENTVHTLRVYFNLNLDQRADIANISNTNIQVSPDLRDRIEEHKSGEGKLRAWCHEIGLLPKGKDFEDKRKADSGFPTVRMARSLIVNFYNGKNFNGNIVTDLVYPVICSTGGSDSDYDSILEKTDSFTSDSSLITFGKAFVRLHQKQILKINEKSIANQKELKEEKKIPLSTLREFRNKALSLAVLSSYAFTAGLLQKYPDRLKKLYSLPDFAIFMAISS